jgi:hypothetical protein
MTKMLQVIMKTIFPAIVGVIGIMTISGLFESAYGQVTDSAFANCVMISGGYTVDVVMLGTDDDCDAGLFEQAVNYYKAQGYAERQYSNMFGEQIMSLEK